MGLLYILTQVDALITYLISLTQSWFYKFLLYLVTSHTTMFGSTIDKSSLHDGEARVN